MRASSKEGTLDEPNGDYDRDCRIRRMRYMMQKVEECSGDDAALEADRPDIMSALVIAHEQCKAHDTEQIELFVRAVTALARFLGYRNQLDERVIWGEAALEAAELLKDDLLIAELCCSTVSWPLLQQGKNEDAARYCMRGLTAAQRCNDTIAAAKWAGYAARTLSGIARDNKDAETARQWARQAAMYAQKCNDQFLIRGAEQDLGYAALVRGDFVEAERKFRAVLELEEQGDNRERIGNRAGDVSLALMNQAIRTEESSERARLAQEARSLIERGLELGQEINHLVMIAEGEMSQGMLARILGDEAAAQRLISSGMRRFDKLGIRRLGRAEQFVQFLDP